MSGLILLIIALFFASPAFVGILPFAIFGALLVFVAIELGKHSFKTESYIITGLVAILSLVVGLVVFYAVQKIGKEELLRLIFLTYRIFNNLDIY